MSYSNHHLVQGLCLLVCFREGKKYTQILPRIFCKHIQALHHFSGFLSASTTPNESELPTQNITKITTLKVNWTSGRRHDSFQYIRPLKESHPGSLELIKSPNSIRKKHLKPPKKTEQNPLGLSSQKKTMKNLQYLKSTSLTLPTYWFILTLYIHLPTFWYRQAI